jgi:hypothetical protein
MITFQRQPDGRALVIAALLKKFGDRIEGGGFEVILKAEEIMALTATGEIKEVPANQEVKLQYFPNLTIEGELVESPKLEEPKPEEPKNE